MLVRGSLCFPLSKHDCILCVVPSLSSPLPLLSLSSLALISLLPCVDYLWPLLTPHTFTRKPHMHTACCAPLCPTFSSLFSQEVSSPSLPCIPCVHSPLSRHPFVLLPVDRAPPAPRLPFTHWCHRGSIITFNRQCSLCSQFHYGLGSAPCTDDSDCCRSHSQWAYAGLLLK